MYYVSLCVRTICVLGVFVRFCVLFTHICIYYVYMHVFINSFLVYGCEICVMLCLCVSVRLHLRVCTKVRVFVLVFLKEC